MVRILYRQSQSSHAITAESKSNNVSFMKVEDLNNDCRNILAVSSDYICYSVTQRKNLLRIIDKKAGDKVILRGHEHSVLDLRFATQDPTVLCSVDGGSATATPAAGESGSDVAGRSHTIVWRRSEGDWKMITDLPLYATLVRPHPNNANLWAIAHKGKMGIFSSSRHGSPNSNILMTETVGAYESLSMNVSLPAGEVITGETSFKIFVFIEQATNIFVLLCYSR